jgi:signal-transduction protein with cAMP-binding, CBS, and nucleotidyltransferase domain
MGYKNNTVDETLVEDYMTVITLTMNFKNSVLDIAKRMVAENISSVAIIDDKNAIIGILTERDIVRIIANEVSPGGVTAGSLMSSPPVTVKNNALIEEAAKIMAGKKVRHLLVEDFSGNNIVGIITVTDLARYLRQKSRTGEELPASEVWKIFF